MHKFLEQLHQDKYRIPGESFEAAMNRIAGALKDGDDHFKALQDILLNRRFLPAGRIQNAMGAPRETTPYNCFVSQTIDDSMQGIMDSATKAAMTMRMGGGIGYDFSTIRPERSLIKTLGSQSSGPISFMTIFDATCKTIASAGHRRGAQMGVLRVDHPDIMKFITAKQNNTDLTAFNVSIGVTDVFMEALKNDDYFDLQFEGQVYGKLKATMLWNEIMRSTWDWAEPGVIFIDTVNKMNNLYYCETIAATNPCGEQPLPPNGACLLGSFNIASYVTKDSKTGRRIIDGEQLIRDIPHVVRAMDNVVDRAIYPLDAQRSEALDKRRMGLGVTGVANAIESAGCSYGSKRFNQNLNSIMETITEHAYKTSSDLGKEKGSFPLYDHEKYMAGNYIQSLPGSIRKYVDDNGTMRNSHLTSVAPTGTISLTAGNVSSGIEPVFAHTMDRVVQTEDGPVTVEINDYAVETFGVRGKTSDECTIDEHLGVLLTASKNVDSAVSKTCNVGDDVSWEDFKNVYVKAYEGGAKGITTFRASGKRFGILTAKPSTSEEDEGAACYFDPNTGQKHCE